MKVAYAGEIVYLSSVGTLLGFAGIFHLQQTCLRCWTRGALVNKAFQHSGKAFVQGNLSLHSLIFGYVEQIELNVALIVVLQVNTVLISTFITPPVKLIQAHPWIKSFIDRIKGRFKKPETDMHQIALEACKETRNELVMLMRVMVTLIVFGAAVPPLLMMTPLFCWLYLCVLTWLEQHSNSADKGLETTNRATEKTDAIGDRVAEAMTTTKTEDEDQDAYADSNEEVAESTAMQLAANLLVQQPIPSFWAGIHVACYACGMLQMLDLNFEIGPIILWTMLNTVAAAVAFGMYRKLQAASRCDRQTTGADCANGSPKQHNGVDISRAARSHQESNPLFEEPATTPQDTECIDVFSQIAQETSVSFGKGVDVSRVARLRQGSSPLFEETATTPEDIEHADVSSQIAQETSISWGESEDSIVHSRQMKPIGWMKKQKKAGNLSSEQFKALNHLGSKEDVAPKQSRGLKSGAAVKRHSRAETFTDNNDNKPASPSPSRLRTTSVEAYASRNNTSRIAEDKQDVIARIKRTRQLAQARITKDKDKVAKNTIIHL